MQKKRSCSGSEISHQVGIVCNILSRLPVKSLMRFKCVSKDWRYIIQDDNYFSNLFHDQSKLRPCLLVVVRLPWELPKHLWGATYILRRVRQANLLTGDLCGKAGRTAAEGGAQVIHNISNAMSEKYDDILEPVNGMMCFTDTTRDFGVRIYNLGTRELTPWLGVAFKIKEGSRLNYRPCYQLGFDPATKEHKVICLWKKRLGDSQSPYLACQVLTVGDNAWRNIEGIPQYDLEDNSLYNGNGGSVYVKGFVYWITDELKFPNHGSEQNVIVAFDVGSEKFRKIALPKLITDQLLYDDDWSFKMPVNLFEVNDRVGVLRKLRVGYPVKMWIHEDNDNKDTSTMGCNQNWTEVEIELPFQWDEETCIKFQGVPGTDGILIEAYEDQRKLRCLSLFYFNLKSMAFTEVECDKLCSSIPHLNSENATEERYVSLVSTFTESLLPVNKKQP
ncbi:hypothetical protein MKW92_032636 [Papaver armeniacum]|nr:hypothetical protein MKW92_032636 [Papaver armeniacum]